jgi:hypothetical protein
MRWIAVERTGGNSLADVQGMAIRHAESGSTLVEALVAAGLLTTVAIGTATLLLVGRQSGQGAEEAVTATMLATSRLERLLAVPWQYPLGGLPPVVPALAVSPADALAANADGYCEFVDDAGLPEGSPGAGAPRFVVRWALSPLASVAVEGRAVEVCVFAWPGAEGAPPIACLASARVRQP